MFVLSRLDNRFQKQLTILNKCFYKSYLIYRCLIKYVTDTCNINSFSINKDLEII